MGTMGALAGWLVVSEIGRIRARARQERAWEQEGLPPATDTDSRDGAG